MNILLFAISFLISFFSTTTLLKTGNQKSTRRTSSNRTPSATLQQSFRVLFKQRYPMGGWHRSSLGRFRLQPQRVRQPRQRSAQSKRRQWRSYLSLISINASISDPILIIWESKRVEKLTKQERRRLQEHTWGSRKRSHWQRCWGQRRCNRGSCSPGPRRWRQSTSLS